jgi:sulfur relay (sulfurtransferase) DsrC/TusE family protein
VLPHDIAGIPINQITKRDIEHSVLMDVSEKIAKEIQETPATLLLKIGEGKWETIDFIHSYIIKYKIINLSDGIINNIVELLQYFNIDFSVEAKGREFQITLSL